MKAEGQPSEFATILGWKVNTKTLTISLSDDKFKMWTKELVYIIENKQKSVKGKTLECILGRLQHAATIFTPGKHFLGRLYSAQQRATRTKFTRLSKIEIEDLQLWLLFLNKVSRGISINLCIPQEPDHIILTDASTTQGLGGYNVKNGKAWRYKLQPWMKSLSINTLEFMSSIIAFEIDIEQNPPSNFDCYLIATDNTAAMGWLKKTNFASIGEQAVQLALARHLAYRLMELNCCISSQWISGLNNCVADMLSREHTLSDLELTNVIKITYPQQVPQSFEICQSQNKACSTIYSLVQPWLSSEVSPTLQILAETHTGYDGLNSLPLSKYKTTISPSTVNLSESPFYQPLSNVLDPNNWTPFEAMAKWHRQHVRNTYPQWQRPSPPATCRIHGLIWTDEFQAFYSDK
jgi:hypothetical protein